MITIRGGFFMFKWLKWAVVMTVAAFVLSGCTSKPARTTDGKLHVVTTFYPLYALAKQIGGDQVSVTCLVPTGVEPHEWTPKMKDMTTITAADMFIYNGAGFEGWVDDFLSTQQLDGLTVIQASKGVSLIQNGTVDPHVWTSPKSAKMMAKNIYLGLVKLDAKHKSTYDKNWQVVQDELTKLQATYRNVIRQAKSREIVVSHDAFAYLARDFGLTQVSLMGLSPESEPTANDMREISDFVKKHDVKYILVEELSSPKLAKTLADDLAVQTLVFHPLEGLTEQQKKAGDTYLKLMEKNAGILQKALH
jgi:zinc transport system substrate-binding protein